MDDHKRKKASRGDFTITCDLDASSWTPQPAAIEEVAKADRRKQVETVKETWKEAFKSAHDDVQVGGGKKAKAAPPSPLPSTSAVRDDEAPVGTPPPPVPAPVSTFDCPYCNKKFSRNVNLTFHIKHKHTDFYCPICNAKFETKALLNKHRQSCTNYGLPQIDIDSEFFKIETTRQLDATHVSYVLSPLETNDSLEIVFAEAFSLMKPVFYKFLDNYKPFKMYMKLFITMYKLTDPSKIIQPIFVKPHSDSVKAFQTYEDVDDNLENEAIEMSKWVETYNKMASNWILQSIDEIHFDCSEIYLVKGGVGKCILPDAIKNSRSVINFELPDSEKCFVYAIAIALNHKQFATTKQS